jgi:hypothetical protein
VWSCFWFAVFTTRTRNVNPIQKKESVELAIPYVTGHIWQDKNRIISNLLGAYVTLNNLIQTDLYLKPYCAARTELAAHTGLP